MYITSLLQSCYLRCFKVSKSSIKFPCALPGTSESSMSMFQVNRIMHLTVAGSKFENRIVKTIAKTTPNDRSHL